MKYRKLLEAAICAPSGDNCQPWRFEVQGDTVRVYNLPGRDTSLFNFRQRASYVAHGALLENLVLAASASGYSANVALFPDDSEADLIAAVSFNPATVQLSPLYDAITARCTNRRRYDFSTLSDNERAALMAAAEGRGGRLVLTVTAEEKSFLAGLVALNDRLVFENENLHAFLFDHIRWNDHQARETRDGLDIKTLDLAPPDSVAFPLLKSWPLVKFLNIFGISRIVAGNARKLALSSSALGLVMVPGSGAANYINAGRLMERVWLEATRIGLSFQLMTGVTFLMQKVSDGDTSGLLAPHTALIADARKRVVERFGLETGTIAVMFRVGRSLPPSARSLRLSVETVVTTEQ